MALIGGDRWSVVISATLGARIRWSISPQVSPALQANWNWGVIAANCSVDLHQAQTPVHSVIALLWSAVAMYGVWVGGTPVCIVWIRGILMHYSVTSVGLLANQGD